MTAREVKHAARECGFELAGVASADPSPDGARYRAWVDAGMAGEMRYLTDRRADVRMDPQQLLEGARSIICVGKLYNTPDPELDLTENGWISRYAWGEDYHAVLRQGLERLVARLPADAGYKICVDTAPLLERSYAYRAGLGWIGKNTCLINEPQGSWFLLGEVVTTLELEPDTPPPDRCGTCRRCIEACPTDAIAPAGYTLDARRCISYLTIELRGPMPEDFRAGTGLNIFGCDICQDVCPWNRRAPVTNDPAFARSNLDAPLSEMAALSPEQFQDMFRSKPIARAKYAGFLRNVAVAMGNTGKPEFREPLEKLAQHESELVREHARWALGRLEAHETTALSENSPDLPSPDR